MLCPGESLHSGKGTGHSRKAKCYQLCLTAAAQGVRLSLSASLSTVHLFGTFLIGF